MSITLWIILILLAVAAGAILYGVMVTKQRNKVQKDLGAVMASLEGMVKADEKDKETVEAIKKIDEEIINAKTPAQAADLRIAAVRHVYSELRKRRRDPATT